MPFLKATVIPIHALKFHPVLAFLGTYSTNGFLNTFSWGLLLECFICFLGVYFIWYLLLEKAAKHLASLRFRHYSLNEELAQVH